LSVKGRRDCQGERHNDGGESRELHNRQLYSVNLDIRSSGYLVIEVLSDEMR